MTPDNYIDNPDFSPCLFLALSATSPLLGVMGDPRQMVYNDDINFSADSPTVTYGAVDYLNRLRSVTSVPSGVGLVGKLIGL